MKNEKRTIRDRTRQFVRDVRIGLSDAALQGKYDIPSNKFYLYKATALDFIAKEDARKTKKKIKINAKQFLVDIWSGMDDEALMAKYKLIPRHLQSAFRQIINAGLITPLELSNRLQITKSQVREAFVEMGKAVRELD
ncbi:MAG TPA: hypothetical protein VMC85_15460 [Desulfomonilaceae bacterium]|nr:hypothetical protein [Desulfomonilaceae bacterium]